MKNNNYKKRLLVILRSASEATENLCENLIRNQLKKNDLLIKCSYVPFFKTLEKAYKIAYSEKYNWTLMIDADVLIKSEAIENLISFGDKYNHLVIQGYVLDYLYGGARSGGLHLYSYEAIKRIYELNPNINLKIRPETYCKNLICPNGYRFSSVPLIFGLHDYFQFENDYYRKVLFFYTKNKDSIASLSKLWREKGYKRIIEIDSLITKKLKKISLNKLEICTTDLEIPDSFKERDESYLLNNISKLNQSNIDNIIFNWYPQKLYLKEFVSIYLRLLLLPDFAKLQLKLLIKNKQLFLVSFFVLRYLLILLTKKNFIRKILKKFF